MEITTKASDKRSIRATETARACSLGEAVSVGARRGLAVERKICSSRTDKVEKIGERRSAVGCIKGETSLDERLNGNLATRVAGVRFSR